MPHIDEGQTLRRESTQPPEIQLPSVEVGSDFCRKIEPTLVSLLRKVGYEKAGNLQAGLLFRRSDFSEQIIIDLAICHRENLEYIDYTREQNELMSQCRRTFRFAVESPNDTKDLSEEILYFSSEGEADGPYPARRRGRSETHPDPSGPEERFESLFAKAYGDSALHALRRERPFVDCAKSTRYIDYALLTDAGPIAIELNGESFHHPRCIGSERYWSQLFKQNSLVASNWRVFRWSLRGMQDEDRFLEEMRRFFGVPEQFKANPCYMATRAVDVFDLMEHQEEALDQISSRRRNGQSTFLVVQPTGTGKTEIFIEDFHRLKTSEPRLNGLVLVPTVTLHEQTKKRLLERLPQYSHSAEYQPRGLHSGFMVQTYQYITRHYESYPPDAFDYVLVDEAHHAVAAGLRSVLQHFRPKVLLGLTATDKRFDQKSLEDVFGSYECNLSLRDAIERGLLPPIRAFRIETNINLSNVRFNGVDYVQADLQRTLLVKSRDTLVADCLVKYFGGSGVKKQGVIFCVNVRHANDMAKVLKGRGFSALAVTGEDRKAAAEALAAYHEGKIQFLCSCQLLTEGWDAPQTSVLVMARPTMSKVLYVQQLGRGTRSHPGKEALYVLDVVDKHGPLTAPWSVHALFGLRLYQPWGDAVASPHDREAPEQEILLSWLHEEERQIREIDIFTFQDKYKDYLSEERLARELFISTGTIKSWIKKGDIQPDITVPFGSNCLMYFAPAQVGRIREQKNLGVHDETTQYEDFFEFLAERDYTFSYKIIFMLALLTCENSRGEAQLEGLSALYRGFYLDRLRQQLPVERGTSPYKREDFLSDLDAVRQSILANPFEKFERKRFMHHCKDLAYIAWQTTLWSRLAGSEDDRRKIFKQMTEDLVNYYKEMGNLGNTTYLRESFPETQVFLAGEAFDRGTAVENALFEEFDASKTYKTCLPFFPLEVAAGTFARSDVGIEPEQWVAVARGGFSRRLTEDMFVTRVTGKSMQPLIPDGSLCIFRRGVGGSRQGLVVLARKSGFTDPETRAAFTVKRYFSSKSINEEVWKHSSIELRPENKEYPILKFDEGDESDVEVIAELVAVLKPPLNAS